MKEFIVKFINIFADIMIVAIFIRVILSWIKPQGAGGKFYIFLYEITEPILGFFRKVIPRIGMLDISPIIAFLVIDFGRALVIGLIG